MADSCKKLFGIVEKHFFERGAGKCRDHGAQLLVEESTRIRVATEWFGIAVSLT